MAANYGDDDALGVCGGDIEAQLEQMRANTIETLRRELGFASDDAAVQDQDGTPTQDQSLAYAAPGQAPDSIFIGENGRGLTNDAARLLAGRQNRINTDGNIIYSAEEHGDPSLPNKWALVGRRVLDSGTQDDTNNQDKRDQAWIDQDDAIQSRRGSRVNTATNGEAPRANPSVDAAANVAPKSASKRSEIDQENARLSNRGPIYEETPTIAGSDLATRRAFVKNGGGAIFHIAPNLSADASAPIFEIKAFNTVNKYTPYIDAAGWKWNVDPDIIRAVMYMEETHGYYDMLLQPIGQNRTILPMNVHDTLWGSDVGTREQLLDPRFNINAGARILAGIQNNLEPQDRTAANIATLYNKLGATQVTNYGARVNAIYQTKPWNKQ